MRAFLISFVSILLLTAPTTHASEPFAVVELFTSEGCSSCPPADQLLRNITKYAEQTSKPIYTLSFHVDYWNQLGWTDPFSKKEFTQRQNRYAQTFQNDSVYTPQMVINGEEGFVGSDRTRALKAVDDSLLKERDNSLNISVEAIDPKTFKILFNLSKVPAASMINIALVEKNLTSHVTRGENAGRTMAHDHVVRLFKTQPIINQKGEETLHLEPEWKNEDLSVIVYVQNQDMKILTINALKLTDKNELIH
jgi:hypothetical protein